VNASVSLLDHSPIEPSSLNSSIDSINLFGDESFTRRRDSFKKLEESFLSADLDAKLIK
jgi:hypothetical protein